MSGRRGRDEPRYAEVDSRKVRYDVVQPWVTRRLKELSTRADGATAELVKRLVKDEDYPDAKYLQRSLEPLLASSSKAHIFVSELWDLLVSAQSRKDGVPFLLLQVSPTPETSERSKVVTEADSTTVTQKKKKRSRSTEKKEKRHKRDRSVTVSPSAKKKDKKVKKKKKKKRGSISPEKSNSTGLRDAFIGDKLENEGKSVTTRSNSPLPKEISNINVNLVDGGESPPFVDIRISASSLADELPQNTFAIDKEHMHVDGRIVTRVATSKSIAPVQPGADKIRVSTDESHLDTQATAAQFGKRDFVLSKSGLSEESESSLKKPSSPAKKDGSQSRSSTSTSKLQSIEGSSRTEKSLDSKPRISEGSPRPTKLQSPSHDSKLQTQFHNRDRFPQGGKPKPRSREGSPRTSKIQPRGRNDSPTRSSKLRPRSRGSSPIRSSKPQAHSRDASPLRSGKTQPRSKDDSRKNEEFRRPKETPRDARDKLKEKSSKAVSPARRQKHDSPHRASSPSRRQKRESPQRSPPRSRRRSSSRSPRRKRRSPLPRKRRSPRRDSRSRSPHRSRRSFSSSRSRSGSPSSLSSSFNSHKPSFLEVWMEREKAGNKPHSPHLDPLRLTGQPLIRGFHSPVPGMPAQVHLSSLPSLASLPVPAGFTPSMGLPPGFPTTVSVSGMPAMPVGMTTMSTGLSSTPSAPSPVTASLLATAQSSAAAKLQQEIESRQRQEKAEEAARLEKMGREQLEQYTEQLRLYHQQIQQQWQAMQHHQQNSSAYPMASVSQPVAAVAQQPINPEIMHYPAPQPVTEKFLRNMAKWAKSGRRY